jgi:hypothetical protein
LINFDLRTVGNQWIAYVQKGVLPEFPGSFQLNKTVLGIAGWRPQARPS